MGSLSNYGEDSFLGHLLVATVTSPTNVYLALCTADPGETGTGATITEVADSNNYARTAISFGTATSRRVTQDADCTFPTASGAWGTVTHWAILDGNTHGAGNVLAYGAFSSSFAPVNGNTPTVASGQVYVQIDASSGAGLSDFAVHELLDHFFNNAAFATTAGSTFIALSTTVLDDADVDEGDFTEATGTGYARVEVNETAGSSPKWTAISGGATSNDAAIDFGTAGASWGTIVACAIMTSASGAGNVLGFDSANIVDQAVSSGDSVSFPTGDFDISLS